MSEFKSPNSERLPESKETKQSSIEQHDFLSLDEIRKLIEDNISRFRTWGYSHVELKSDQPLHDYNGNIIAVPLDCYKTKKEQYETHYIALNLNGHSAEYLFSANNENLFTTDIPPSFNEEWLLESSRVCKVVKSRPAFLYPELFDLPHQEVWPKDSKIAVIGDPYQTCDREDVTIVEYEYADEIVPPILSCFEEYPGEREDTIRKWYFGLYNEDTRALENMYGPYTPDERGNPYTRTAYNAIDLASRIASMIHPDTEINPDEIEKYKEEISSLKRHAKMLIDGTWNVRDFEDLFDQGDHEELIKFFDYKQETIESMGDTKKWEDFIDRWHKYLDKFPMDEMKENIPDLEARLKQVNHWLEVLPASKSPQRITSGMNYLEKFYYNMLEMRDHNVDIHKDPLFNTEIEEARSKGMMADSAFGFFVPGYPVSLRTKNALEIITDQSEKMMIYLTKIWPHINERIDDLKKKKITLNEETLYSYLRSFEHPLAQENLFVRRAQKAVPIHGYFPYNVSLDQQDRILALTSVTMHGWNNLDKSGFSNDIEKALPFLKPGGKYILGPINQHIYFGGYNSNFDTLGLTQALKELKEAGEIDYYFRKGRREHGFEFDDRSPENNEIAIDSREDELLPNEAAHSLVIIKK